MKKLLTLFLSILLVLSLAGCGQTSVKIDAMYWQNSTQNYDNTFSESLMYDVTCESSTISNSTKIENEEIAFVVNQGTYTITSKSVIDAQKGENVVCVETVLEMDGKYVVKADNSELSFVEEITTTCYFVANSFKPISSTKNVKATTLGVENGKYMLFDFEYKYDVDYSGNDANVTFTEIKDDYSVINVETSRQYKDVTKNAYLDNEMIIFAPRGYNLLGNTNFSVSFESIDVISKTTRGMFFTTMSNNQSNPTTITINAFGQDIETVRVNFQLTGQFVGTPIECYYASKSENKNRLVVCYTQMYGNLGYLKYTLKEVK